MTFTLLSVALVGCACFTLRVKGRLLPFLLPFLLAGYLLLTLWVATLYADPAPQSKRSSAVRRTFLQQHDLTHTPKGCQVDHKKPLVCGGPDTLDNLQLLCGSALKEKERTERRCRNSE